MIEGKLKHLEFVQSVISRMAQNSFLIKGWVVTLLAAVFALYQQKQESFFIAIAYFIIVLFWALDAYYLSMERRFRALYERVASTPNEATDFRMSTADFNNGPNTWQHALISPSLLLFYAALSVVAVLFRFVIKP